MAITFVADTKVAQSAVGGTITVTAPAGIVDGDLLVLIFSHGYNLTSIPTGWTQIAFLSNQGGTYVFTRSALATDTSWVFTLTNATHVGTAWCGAYRGVVAVRTVSVFTSGNILTTVQVPILSALDGVRIDALVTRRDAAPASIHAAPAWGTRRAYLDASNAGLTIHWEMSVVERPANAGSSSDTWTMTTPPSSSSFPHHLVLIWLSDTLVLQGVLVDPFDKFLASPLSFQAHVYKGRALSTDDTPEAP